MKKKMKNLNAMNVKDSDIWEMNVQTSSKTRKMTRIKKKRKKKEKEKKRKWEKDIKGHIGECWWK